MLFLLNHALRRFPNGAVIDRSKTCHTKCDYFAAIRNFGNTSSSKSCFEKFVGKGHESSGCRYFRSIFNIF